ncbi:hypothetical protein AB0K18_42940 [Nonomuraea sp. NPDC049421]|uniref:hypothetical protein n=1 Tax=Nonomuraea sp. NPDC049421 TaxID=3155275 RepID=UPI0034402495
MTDTPETPARPFRSSGCALDADGWCRIHQWDCADYGMDRVVDEGERDFLTTEELAARLGIDLDTEGDDA